MSTIYDVADLAGVSAKTVSRVLNADKAVKADTRERVLGAMAQLDYKPNRGARELRLSPSANTIGILLEDPAGGYQGRFHHAMLTACMEAGKHLAVGLGTLNGDNLGEAKQFLGAMEIKSMVLLPPLCDYGPLRSFLKINNIDCILVSPSTPDTHFQSVALDDRLAARNVTDYLLDLGHKKIAHITGHPDHVAGLLRRQGYLEAFDAAGLPRPPAHYVAEGQFDFRSGMVAAEKILTLADRPTAIFAANDEMAAAACAVAHKMGIDIPQQLSVIGFDDAPIASAVWPALSTVRQPYIEMARRAIQLLSDHKGAGLMIERDVFQARHVLPHEIILRDSTAKPAES